MCVCVWIHSHHTHGTHIIELSFQINFVYNKYFQYGYRLLIYMYISYLYPQCENMIMIITSLKVLNILSYKNSSNPSKELPHSQFSWNNEIKRKRPLQWHSG